MQSGTHLGPYEILSRIGAGGMGEVWRARDTRLGRDVAVKILPEEFARDAKLKIRFEHEARTISHLTHPNICTLFDVGENYLVMELLEGESLAHRLSRGPLPFTEVVRYGVQIAEALGAAHKHGIVHRDVKPGNVMLTKSGAKLLDFGLAKSTRVEASSRDETVQKPITEQGAILGTFQYMAPEQIAGEEPDARTDIFALGAVLYEMATGKRAFEGKDRTSVVAAIVSGEPRAIRDLQPLTPAALEHVILKCLEKDRDSRWQNATDIAEELRWISETGSQTGVASIVATPRRWRERLLWIAALVAMMLTTAGVVMTTRRPTATDESIEAALSVDPTGGFSYYSGPPSLSPDGRTLAFSASDKSGRTMLWIRALSDSAPRPLANTEGALHPFWSADGKFIGFTASGLRRIPASGGNADVIARQGGPGTWNRDGVILIGLGRAGIFRIAATGGEAIAALRPGSVRATSLTAPWFLPDGRHFLFVARGDALKQNDQEGVWVAELDGAEKPHFVTAASSSNASYVVPGWLLFGRDGFLRAQRFDLKSLRVEDEAAVVAPVQSDVNVKALFSASDSGVLVYVPPGSRTPAELRLKKRSGEILRTFGRGDYYVPRVSHDGRTIAVDVTEEATSGDIWTIGLQNGSTSRFTFEKENESSPTWSPDDTAIAYEIGEKRGESGIAVRSPGKAAEQVVDLPETMLAPLDWSRDGEFLLLLYRGGRRNSTADVAVVSLLTREITDIAATPAREAAAVFSPDSKWVAYQSDESGRPEIYVQPYPVTGAKYQVSTAGGHWPRWRVQGEITYVDETNHLTAVRVVTTNGLTADPPRTLPATIDSHGGSVFCYYDLAPDGNIVENAMVRDDPAPLTLITNWPKRLRTTATK